MDLATNLYAHTFTCTYKHMQSSGQLEGAPLNKTWDLAVGLAGQGLAEGSFFLGSFAEGISIVT
ncbi:hypothetical protein [Pseudomonas gingeri]|uniref:Uncharacterized protein n=1 Tax=Pseudomonas gingeri TaxID=117681 RepID=A0A7Y7WE93_9PSED|nr:hypothetical protein [Pseudomonas gingeri]NWB47795.1 hypothetical protein [Pseudomonas gingeri]